jgi:hypothetical protein
VSRLPKQPLSAQIFRICDRIYQPWALRSRDGLLSDGTFGYRWDDPNSEYRLLYAAQDRVVAFVEKLQRFIPPPDMVAMRAVVTYDPADGPPSLDPFAVPEEWADDQVIGYAAVDAGDFANVAASEALWHFHERLAPLAVELRLENFVFDLSALFARSPRRLSQSASRVVYEDPARFAGIVCPSHLGIELINVSLFENAHAAPGMTRGESLPETLTQHSSQPVASRLEDVFANC